MSDTQSQLDEIYQRLMESAKNEPQYFCPGCKKKVLLNRLLEESTHFLCLECGSTEKPIVILP